MKLQNHPLLTMPYHLPGGSFHGADIMPISPADASIEDVHSNGDKLIITLRDVSGNRHDAYIRVQEPVTEQGLALLTKIYDDIRRNFIGETYATLLNTDI